MAGENKKVDQIQFVLNQTIELKAIISQKDNQLS